ncbi:MAG: hypothetical protein H0X01_06530 [Nitrospira sp.]|nr:hypothetical protein [Nitrospira sp.]
MAGDIQVSLIEDEVIGVANRIARHMFCHAGIRERDGMQERENPLQPGNSCHVGISYGIDDFRGIGHARALQDDQGRLIVLHELRDAPGEVVFRIATNAASGQVEDLIGNRSGARAIDADFPGLIHEDPDLVALTVPEFQETHEQGRLAGAERSAEDVKGDGE